MTTFGQTALAIAIVAGISLVFLGIGIALGSFFLLLVAIGFTVLSAIFVHRLLRP